jgi:hypothetical protein
LQIRKHQNQKRDNSRDIGNKKNHSSKNNTKARVVFLFAGIIFLTVFSAVIFILIKNNTFSGNTLFADHYDSSIKSLSEVKGIATSSIEISSSTESIVSYVDKKEYDNRMLYVTHVIKTLATTSTTQLASTTEVSTTTPVFINATTTNSTSTNIVATNTESKKSIFKPKIVWNIHAPYPRAGALLPFNRIVAYYGNLLSTKMGVLGEYPEDEMLQKLQDVTNEWRDADPETPVIPALDYIVTTAQGAPGDLGLYRAAMQDTEVDKIITMAKKTNAIVILDFQVGLSTIQHDLPLYRKYLEMPNVHIALDPEFSMKHNEKPGSVIGTFDADDINFAINYVSEIVKKNNIPPKIVVVHRFTQNMVTNYQNIEVTPETEFVMDMDGWGKADHKMKTYNLITSEPVQFTGFKLFYKNDFRLPGSTMMTPKQVLKLKPAPLFIQYQ